MDRNWPTAASWIARKASPSRLGKLGVIGVPVRHGSVTPGRCDLAPAAIRGALAKFSTLDLLTGRDLADLTVRDFGDLDVAGLTPGEAAPVIRDNIRVATECTDALILLGGNNSITWPACSSIGNTLNKCALLTLDAHFDLRDLDAGPNNGNPVRALLADGLPGSHIVQIGIQSFANSPAYAAVARSAGIHVVGIEQVRSVGIREVVSQALGRLAERADWIYVDLDLDVLDRCFAPATPGSRPGGMQPSDLLEAARCCGEHPKVMAIDLVEMDPERDVADVTVLTAASCFLSFAAGYIARVFGANKGWARHDQSDASPWPQVS